MRGVDSVLKFGAEILKHSWAGSKRVKSQIAFAVDGCFQFTHYRHVVASSTARLEAETRVLVDETIRDQFPPTKNTSDVESNSCSNFNAVDNVFGKRTDSKDVTGLFGAVCVRHNVPLRGTFSFLSRGERYATFYPTSSESNVFICSYAYADRVLHHIYSTFRNNGDGGMDIIMFYDIACQYRQKVETVRDSRLFDAS